MKEFNFPKVKRVSKRTLAQDLVPMKPDEVAEELGELYKWILGKLGDGKEMELEKAIRSKRKLKKYLISEIVRTMKENQAKDERREND